MILSLYFKRSLFTGISPLLFSNSGVGSFASHKNQIPEGVVRRELRFNCLKMSQHFLFSHFKDPECCPGQGLNPRPPAQQTGALN